MRLLETLQNPGFGGAGATPRDGLNGVSAAAHGLGGVGVGSGVGGGSLGGAVGGPMAVGGMVSVGIGGGLMSPSGLAMIAGRIATSPEFTVISP